jgi:hypothetical protein
MVPGALTSAEGHAGQPEDEENHCQDPKDVQSEPKPRKQEHE